MEIMEMIEQAKENNVSPFCKCIYTKLNIFKNVPIKKDKNILWLIIDEKNPYDLNHKTAYLDFMGHRYFLAVQGNELVECFGCEVI